MPRAFSYVANWARTRQALLPDLNEMVDVGRAWQEVNLEQVIAIQRRGDERPEYRSLRRADESFRFVTDIPKAACVRFGILPRPESVRELALGRKMATHRRLGDYLRNRRGAGLQNQIRDDLATGRSVLSGKRVQRWRIVDSSDYIPQDTNLPANAFVQPGSILAQNILTFSTDPVAHIRITAALVPENPNFIILDTVNQLRLKEHCPYSAKFLLALLNSKLIHWYSWRFIYSGARMTIHFDTPASAPLPVPRLDFDNSADRTRHDALAASADRMLALHAELAHSEELFDDRRHELQRRIDELDTAINAQVYALYGLGAEEIALVEGRAN